MFTFWSGMPFAIKLIHTFLYSEYVVENNALGAGDREKLRKQIYQGEFGVYSEVIRL